MVLEAPDSERIAHSRSLYHLWKFFFFKSSSVRVCKSHCQNRRQAQLVWSALSVSHAHMHAGGCLALLWFPPSFSLWACSSCQSPPSGSLSPPPLVQISCTPHQPPAPLRSTPSPCPPADPTAPTLPLLPCLPPASLLAPPPLPSPCLPAYPTAVILPLAPLLNLMHPPA